MLWWFAETSLIAALLAVLATLAGRRRRFGPEARHAFWLLILIRLMLPPVVSWPWSLPRPWADPPADVATASGLALEPLPEPAATGGADPPIGELASIGSSPDGPDEIPAPAAPDPRLPVLESEIWDLQSAIPRLLIAGWLAGSVAVVGLGLARIVRFRRTLAGARPAPGWLAEEARAMGDRLGVRTPPILVTPGGRTPLLWCPGRPVLLVPSALVKTLAADRWPGILAHELAHLGRRDHWVVRLELVAGAIWWWNPLFWHVRRRLHDEAELACDARVARALAGGRFTYAEALIEVCEHLSRSADPIPSPALGVVGPGASRSLEGRLEMILREPAARPPARLAALAVATLATLAIPGWTLAPPEPPEPPRAEAPKPEPDPKPSPEPKAELSVDVPTAGLAPDSGDFLLLGEDAATWGLDPNTLKAVMLSPEITAAAVALRKARGDLDDVIRRSKSAADPEEQAARARLAAASREYARVLALKAGEARKRAERVVPSEEDRARRSLETDPELMSRRIKFMEARSSYEKTIRVARDPADPAIRLAQSRYESAKEQYQKLAEAKANKDRDPAGEAPIFRARRDGKAAEVRKAEAQLRLARSVVARNDVLRKKNPNLVSDEEVAKGEAELAVAEAELDGRKAALAEADANLSRVAPQSSPTRESPTPSSPPPARAPEPGEKPDPEAATAPWLSLKLSGPDVSRPGERVDYRITVANTGADLARRVQVSATLPPQGGRLKPGPMPAGATFDKGGRKLAWTLPVIEPGQSVDLAFVYETDKAGLYRCLAELASGETRLSRELTTGVIAEPPPPAVSPSALADARDSVELLEVQIRSKRAELDGATARTDLARRQNVRIKVLVERNAVEARLADEAAANLDVAEANLTLKKAEVAEFEVRIKQARRRAEAEEAGLRADLARIKARAEWSASMRAKGYVSEATAAADLRAYDAAMTQLDPNFRPVPVDPAEPKGPGRR